METYRKFLRRVATTWALAAGSLALAGCPAGERSGSEEVADLTLRQVMYQIDFAYREVRTNLRNTGFYPRHRELLRSLSDWIEQPSWAAWLEREDFHGDPARFLGMQDTLRQATSEARAAAEEEDLEALRGGFVGMYSSCIACHKRYKPTY